LAITILTITLQSLIPPDNKTASLLQGRLPFSWRLSRSF
jgi:hypothetical protein